jgi:hypothetical protein
VALVAAILIVMPTMVVAEHSEEEMAQWQRAATPGAAHGELAQQAGSWTYVVTIWEGPNSEPMRLEGIAKKTMVMGGRYLQEELSGAFMGQEFTGFGITGYDNVAAEFVSIWLDNMSTTMARSTGKNDGSGTLVFRSEHLSPSGEKLKTRSLIDVTDGDHHTYQAYMTKRGEKEFLHMSVEYTRVGS